MSIFLSARQIWGMPILIAVFSAVGLLSALLVDGVGDVVSWFALGAPVAVIIWNVCVSSFSGWPKAGNRP